MLNLTEVEGQLGGENDTFPAVISNHGNIGSLTDVTGWLKKNKDTIESQLDQSGAVLFRGFPVNSAEDFDQFSAAFGYSCFTYQESLSNAVRINYTERVFSANEAPKHVAIHLHNEMAQTPKYPEKIFFSCMTPADSGGASPLCRCDLLYQAIHENSPSLAKKMRELGVKYTTHMPNEDAVSSGQGRSWRNTLSVENAQQAQVKLKDLGYSWQWLDDNSLKVTTAALPAVKTLSNGRTVFFNQIIAAFMGWQGVRENPSLALRYGDGSVIDKQDLELIVRLSEACSFDLEWQRGDVALVDNLQVMHGRKPYLGDTKRLVLVALGGPQAQ